MSGHKSIVHVGIRVGCSLIHTIYTPNNECQKLFVEVESAPNGWAESETRMTHDWRYTSVFQARSIGDKSISLGMLILNPLVAFL